MPDQPLIRRASSDGNVSAAHALFTRRIGAHLVEDVASFAGSAGEDSADWLPRLLLAEVDGRLAAAQLGGLLPAVQMLSLPYTAVDEAFEGRGVYLALKRAMLAELRDLAAARGLPEPSGNVSEEVPGSAQYRRKIERGIATVLPIPYAQPAVQGLAERPLALTFEPLVTPPPAFTLDQLIAIVAAVYRGLYRIAAPERDPTFRRIVATMRGRAP